MLRDAPVLVPKLHSTRVSVLINLSVSILTLIGRTGDHSHLNDAIGLLHDALSLPLRPIALNNHAIAFLARFRQAGEGSDLNEVIVLHREAFSCAFTPTDLNTLANVIMSRFKQAGGRSDLDEAIGCAGDYLDLNEAVVLLREALSLLPVPHPERLTPPHYLAVAVAMRSEHTGNPSDLDEAIAFCRGALNLRPALQTARPILLSVLATTILKRFDGTVITHVWTRRLYCNVERSVCDLLRIQTERPHPITLLGQSQCGLDTLYAEQVAH